jgi:hypothetical protein
MSGKMIHATYPGNPFFRSCDRELIQRSGSFFIPNMSFPRKRESRNILLKNWMPAYAGMKEKLLCCSINFLDIAFFKLYFQEFMNLTR